MIYLEFESLKIQRQSTFEALRNIINEKEELFSRTQPASVDYDKERVSGGGVSTPFDDYVIAKEARQIDQRIEECKAILAERENLLKRKEGELRASKDICDVIYVLRFLEHMRLYKIASRIHYSEAQTYRLYSQISNQLDRLRGNDSK